MFFDSFEFHHSLQRLDDLEDILWSRVASDTNSGGWHAFRFCVEQWSTRKRRPEPDGRIRHFHLREAFSVERSKPLPQNFVIPSNYSVPNKTFDKYFIEKISTSNGVSVLWGAPGCGKSTFLSHCVNEIDQDLAVCIRHHYFLSLDDRSEGRFHYHAIRQSFEHQILDALPGFSVNQQGLGELLEKAARQLRGEGRRLVVIIDGLDHVWREHRDREDMEALFDALLPVPENLELVVGTQKIANEFLPTKLLTTIPVEEWTELPLMSLDAVYRWLAFQDSAGRLELEILGRGVREEAFRDVADAFHKVSHGLPLHLIYSFENILLVGKPISESSVSSLPECPDGDIRNYYSSLWERLKPKAKVVLHVLAGLQFGPPPFAMYDCFGRNDETLEAFSEINHLLDRRETEVRPFHGSLFAFLREERTHTETFATHAGDVLAWLETNAPKYWRWAWLWITSAQLGDVSALLAMPTREWAIQSLINGFPIEQISTILDQAETAAFEAFDLPRFHALRSLSTRVRNGPKYQTHEWPLFQEVAVTLTSDPYAQALLRSKLHQLPIDLLPFVVRNSHSSLQKHTLEEAIADINQRMSSSNTAYPTGIEQDHDAAHAIVAVAAHGGSDHRDRIEQFAKRDQDGNSLIASYARASMIAGNFENVLEVGKRWSGPLLDRDVLAALCMEGLTPNSTLGLQALSHPAIRSLALLTGGACSESVAEHDLSPLFAQREHHEPDLVYDLADALYDAFFNTLVASLSGDQSQYRVNIPTNVETTWLATAVRALENIPRVIAKEWMTSGHWPCLADLYKSFHLPPDTSERYKGSQQFIGVQIAIRTIAVDLCTIAIALNPGHLITANDMTSVEASPYWSYEAWLEIFTSRRLNLHEPRAALIVVQRIGHAFDETISEFCERSNTAIKLALFACDHELSAIARKELKRAIGCLLGYGFRKDPYALEILDSLEFLLVSGDPEAKQILLSLAGEFECICDYTDGDETDYFRKSYYGLLAEYFPHRVASCYANLIRNEEWSYCEALAKAVARTKWVDTIPGQALLNTYISPSEIRALEKSTSPQIMRTLNAVRNKTGRIVSLSDQDAREAEEHNRSGTPTPCPDNMSAPDPDPKAYPPGQFVEFMNAVRKIQDYGRADGLAGKWLQLWDRDGQAQEALADLEELCSTSGSALGWRGTLDDAFSVALRSQGRSRAFPWIVRAHVDGAGWSRWMGGEKEVRRRLRMVASHYPNRWKEFITETSRPEFAGDAGRNGLVIGLSRLVFFLMQVGEPELARSYTLQMVDTFRQELSEQPIELPDWAR